jgi:hypothetical protein
LPAVLLTGFEGGGDSFDRIHSSSV